MGIILSLFPNFWMRLFQEARGTSFESWENSVYEYRPLFLPLTGSEPSNRPKLSWGVISYLCAYIRLLGQFLEVFEMHVILLFIMAILFVDIMRLMGLYMRKERIHNRIIGSIKTRFFTYRGPYPSVILNYYKCDHIAKSSLILYRAKMNNTAHIEQTIKKEKTKIWPDTKENLWSPPGIGPDPRHKTKEINKPITRS